MNATKRIAVTRHILNQFAKNKQHPPMNLAEMPGRQLRQLARHLGILRKRVTFTPLNTSVTRNRLGEGARRNTPHGR